MPARCEWRFGQQISRFATRMSLSSMLTRLLPRRASEPAAHAAYEKLTHAWQRRCARFPLPDAPRSGTRRRAVLVTPWLGSAVPFFSLEVARMLAAGGEDVRVIYDACNVIGNAPHPHEIELLNCAVAALPPKIPVLRVEQTGPIEAGTADAELARRIIYENGVWRMRGEAAATRFVARKERSVAHLAEHAARVRRMVSDADIDWLLIPGGIWGISWLYVEAARHAHLSYATYDSGDRVLFLCQDGIAAQDADLPRAIAMLRAKVESRPDSRAQMVEWSRRELAERQAGRGNYATFQARAATGEAAGDVNVLVPLNVRWDAAALGRTRLFADVREWISAIVHWAAGEPAARVCFRQHPIERRGDFKSSDDFAALVHELNTVGDRVRFIRAADPVSTYDLLANVRVLLPFTSSMGVEAPMLGIPVVTSAHTYYENLDFVYRAESPVHYFQLISAALRGELSVSPAARESAAIVYFLMQHCNIMPTAFTATPTEFFEWVEIPPSELWDQPELRDLQRAMLTGEPLSFVRVRRFLAET
jgi:hypothetical protein